MKLYGWLGFKTIVLGASNRSSLRWLLAVSAILCLIILGAGAAETTLKAEGGIRTWRSQQLATLRAETGLWLHARNVPTGSGSELTVVSIASEDPGAELGWPEFATVPPPGTAMISRRVEGLEAQQQELVMTILGLDGADLNRHKRVPDTMLIHPNEMVAIEFITMDEMQLFGSSSPILPGIRVESYEPPSVAFIVIAATFFAAATLLLAITGRYLRGIAPTLATFRLLNLATVAIRTIAIVPVVVTSLLGSALGLVVFESIRRILAGSASHQLLANRALLSWGWLAAAVLLTVLGTSGLAAIAVSRVVRRPLATVRRDEKPTSHFLLAVSALFASVSTLLVRAVFVNAGSSAHVIMWWAAVPLMLIGLIGILRRSITLAAEREWSSPATVVSSGIVRESARETRTLFEPALVILFLCSVLVPLMFNVDLVDPQFRDSKATVMLSNAFATGARNDEVSKLVGDLVGSDSVGTIGTTVVKVRAEPTRGIETLSQIWIGTCADLRILFADDLATCTPRSIIFPPGSTPASIDKNSNVLVGLWGTLPSGRWQTGTIPDRSVYWAIEDWLDVPKSGLAREWIITSAPNTADVLALSSVEAPDFEAVLPVEQAKSQAAETRLLRTLIFAGIGMTMSLASLAYLAGIAGFMRSRLTFMEHLVRLGMNSSQVATVMRIVVLGPITLGAFLLLPTGFITGSLLSENLGSWSWWLALPLLFLGFAGGSLSTALARAVALREPQRQSF